MNPTTNKFHINACCPSPFSVNKLVKLMAIWCCWRSFQFVDDTLTDLNHDAARHRIAVRPNNRRTPSRLANGNLGPLPRSPSPKPLTRSASLSSLDFIQIQEECNALLKTKAHSFKALPALFLLDHCDVVQESLSPNVIMVRTLPHMKVKTAGVNILASITN